MKPNTPVDGVRETGNVNQIWQMIIDEDNDPTSDFGKVDLVSAKDDRRPPTTRPRAFSRRVIRAWPGGRPPRPRLLLGVTAMLIPVAAERPPPSARVRNGAPNRDPTGRTPTAMADNMTG